MTAADNAALKVVLAGVERTFRQGADVTLGRDPRSTLSVDHPLVSRQHAVISWRGRWVLTDLGSTNGVYVDGRRISGAVPLDRPLQVRLGDPADGPVLVLDPGTGSRAAAPPVAPPVTPPFTPPRPSSRPTPLPATPPGPARPLLAGASYGIGRTPENTIVVNDVLVSRAHARLTPNGQGLLIEDLGSANGTFVNGRRVDQALLRDADVVTVGNTDFVVTGGTLAPRQKATVASGGLDAHGVGFAVGTKQLLADVDLTAAPGTLTALIGPSGAGKSTFSRLLAGLTQPTQGAVLFQGHNLHADYAALRSRIGMVPQDDVLHRQLTVQQALAYAAELRLPPDLTATARDEVVRGVLHELSLSEHLHTRIDRLSGGQRKRVSVAMELLTGPSMLILDEPTSGLDPALDRQVMAMLRQLADAGRVVVVVTHSLTHLDMCDQILLLAPGGRPAYCGAPAGVGPAMGSTDWAEIFGRVTARPEEAYAAHRSRVPRRGPAPATRGSGALGRPAHTSASRQVSTLIRRQARLIVADTGYLAFLAVLPFILGVLSLVVPGSAGFGQAKPSEPTEATQLLVLIVMGACFMGLAISIRDLVGERAIYLRERAAGLITPAYLFSKVAVFCTVATVQAAVLVVIVVIGKGAPKGASLLGSGTLELFVAVAATASCCVLMGLALSGIARSADQVMPLLVVALMTQLVMCGGLIPVTKRPVLDQLSWLLPSRWGYAASASTADVRKHVLTAQPDKLWNHQPEIWFVDTLSLAALGVIFTWIALSRLKRSS